METLTKTIVSHRGKPTHQLDLDRCIKALRELQQQGSDLDTYGALAIQAHIGRSTVARFFKPDTRAQLRVGRAIVSVLGLEFEQVARPISASGSQASLIALRPRRKEEGNLPRRIRGGLYLTPEGLAAMEGVRPITVRVACRQYEASGGKLGLKAEKFSTGRTAPWWIRPEEVPRWRTRRRAPGNRQPVADALGALNEQRRRVVEQREPQGRIGSG